MDVFAYLLCMLPQRYVLHYYYTTTVRYSTANHMKQCIPGHCSGGQIGGFDGNAGSGGAGCNAQTCPIGDGGGGGGYSNVVMEWPLARKAV